MCRLKSIWARDLKFPWESRGPSNLRIPEYKKSIQLGSSTKIECYQGFLTRFQAKTPSSQMFLTYRLQIRDSCVCARSKTTLINIWIENTELRCAAGENFNIYNFRWWKFLSKMLALKGFLYYRGVNIKTPPLRSKSANFRRGFLKVPKILRILKKGFFILPKISGFFSHFDLIFLKVSGPVAP